MGAWRLRSQFNGDGAPLPGGAVVYPYRRLRVVLWLMAAAIPTSLLGFFLGMFTCWPWIRVICSRFNSAPLQIGDRVLILSGPQKGTTAEVYEITVGQGGTER